MKTRISGPVLAIGDLHGRRDEFEHLLSTATQQGMLRGRTVVLMGDYVDRGPDSRGLIDLILDFAQSHPVSAIMGNHDLAMSRALGRVPGPNVERIRDAWVKRYGSDSTFESYGVAAGDIDSLQRALPDAHADFLANLPWIVTHPDYVFVHAGLDPSLPSRAQIDLLKRRDYSLGEVPWLESKSFLNQSPPPDVGREVVVGHVVVERVTRANGYLKTNTTDGDVGDVTGVLLPEGRVLHSSGEVSPIEAPAVPKPGFLGRLLGSKPAGSAW